MTTQLNLLEVEIINLIQISVIQIIKCNNASHYCPNRPGNLKYNNYFTKYGSDNSYTKQNHDIGFKRKEMESPAQRNSQLVTCNKSHTCESHSRTKFYKKICTTQSI